MKIIFKHTKKNKRLKNIGVTYYIHKNKLSPKQFLKALHTCHFFSAGTGYVFNLPAKIHIENPESTGGHVKDNISS